MKMMLGLCAVLVLGLMPLKAAAQGGNPARERGEVVICRGAEAHTCGQMVKVGQEAPDFRAVNAVLEEVSLSSYRGKRIILNIAKADNLTPNTVFSVCTSVQCSCFETGKYCRALPVDGPALCAVPFLYN